MKFNNLGLALGMDLKFYISVAEGLRLKVGLVRGGGVGGLFASLPILNRVKMIYFG